MDLEKYIKNEVQNQRNEEMKTSPQLMLGEIIVALEAVKDKSVSVNFDFEYAYPTKLCSWRGIYRELAIQFEFDPPADGEQTTVEDVLEEFKSAIGKTFTGYKGGDFVMGKNTPVWVARYGNSGNTAITGVKDLGYWCIIETRYLET